MFYYYYFDDPVKKTLFPCFIAALMGSQALMPQPPQMYDRCDFRVYLHNGLCTKTTSNNSDSRIEAQPISALVQQTSAVPHEQASTLPVPCYTSPPARQCRHPAVHLSSEYRPFTTSDRCRSARKVGCSLVEQPNAECQE